MQVEWRRLDGPRFDSLVCGHGRSKVLKGGRGGRRRGRRCARGIGRCRCKLRESRLVVLKSFLVVKVMARGRTDQVRVLTGWDPLLDLEVDAEDINGGVAKRSP